MCDVAAKYDRLSPENKRKVEAEINNFLNAQKKEEQENENQG